MEAETAYREREKGFTCSICQKIFTDPVSLKACLHKFCKQCCLRILEDKADKAVCPLCREAFKEDDIKRDCSFNEQLDIFKSERKPTAGDNGPVCSCANFKAGCFCKHCPAFLCDSCKNAHSTFPPLKEHEVVKIDDLTAQALGSLEAQSKVIAQLETSIDQIQSNQSELQHKLDDNLISIKNCERLWHDSIKSYFHEKAVDLVSHNIVVNCIMEAQMSLMQESRERESVKCQHLQERISGITEMKSSVEPKHFLKQINDCVNFQEKLQQSQPITEVKQTQEFLTLDNTLDGIKHKFMTLSDPNSPRITLHFWDVETGNICEPTELEVRDDKVWRHDYNAENSENEFLDFQAQISTPATVGIPEKMCEEKEAIKSAPCEPELELRKEKEAVKSAPSEPGLEVCKEKGAVKSAPSEPELELCKEKEAVKSAPSEPGLELCKEKGAVKSAPSGPELQSDEMEVCGYAVGVRPEPEGESQGKPTTLENGSHDESMATNPGNATASAGESTIQLDALEELNFSGIKVPSELVDFPNPPFRIKDTVMEGSMSRITFVGDDLWILSNPSKGVIRVYDSRTNGNFKYGIKVSHYDKKAQEEFACEVLAVAQCSGGDIVVGCHGFSSAGSHKLDVGLLEIDSKGSIIGILLLEKIMDVTSCGNHVFALLKSGEIRQYRKNMGKWERLRQIPLGNYGKLDRIVSQEKELYLSSWYQPILICVDIDLDTPQDELSPKIKSNEGNPVSLNLCCAYSSGSVLVADKFNSELLIVQPNPRWEVLRRLKQDFKPIDAALDRQGNLWILGCDRRNLSQLYILSKQG